MASNSVGSPKWPQTHGNPSVSASLSVEITDVSHCTQIPVSLHLSLRDIVVSKCHSTGTEQGVGVGSSEKSAQGCTLHPTSSRYASNLIMINNIYRISREFTWKLPV